jgi:hypothetical protein
MIVYQLELKSKFRLMCERGNDIPCHKYVYDVVNGKEILIESESGSVVEE